VTKLECCQNPNCKYTKEQTRPKLFETLAQIIKYTESHPIKPIIISDSTEKTKFTKPYCFVSDSITQINDVEYFSDNFGHKENMCGLSIHKADNCILPKWFLSSLASYQKYFEKEISENTPILLLINKKDKDAMEIILTDLRASLNTDKQTLILPTQEYL